MNETESPQRLNDLATGVAAVEVFNAGKLTFDYERTGHVEPPPPPAGEPMVVCTLRLPPTLYLRLKRLADERGIRPSTLMRELMEAALDEREGDTVVTVRLADLHRAIDQVARPAA